MAERRRVVVTGVACSAGGVESFSVVPGSAVASTVGQYASL